MEELLRRVTARHIADRTTEVLLTAEMFSVWQEIFEASHGEEFALFDAQETKA